MEKMIGFKSCYEGCRAVDSDNCAVMLDLVCRYVLNSPHILMCCKVKGFRI
jgi:hypothetical protein